MLAGTHKLKLLILIYYEIWYQESLDKDVYAVFVVPTWTDGGPSPAAAPFAAWLNDLATDFRVSKDMFSKMRFAAFGLGDSSFGTNFCRFVRCVDAHVAATCLLDCC